MHLVQAGASILSSWKVGNIIPEGNGLHFNCARTNDPTVRCDRETAAGFSDNLRDSRGGRGGVIVLTSPDSGPLSLTSPRDGLESAMKEGASLSPSSSEWEEYWDEEAEASYYFNCVTREALWVRPDGF